jgi:thiol-disulfide isomerase/thioredoxin
MTRTPVLSALFLIASTVFLFSAVPAGGADPPGESPSAPSLPLDSLRGKVVLVDFWASWCGPCKKSFPWMNSLLEKHSSEGLVILAVNLDKKRADADAFLAKQEAGPRIVFDPGGVLAKSYALQAMPSSFIYDRRGTLREKHLGFTEKDAKGLEEKIIELLAEEADSLD